MQPATGGAATAIGDELEQMKMILRQSGFSEEDLASFTPEQIAGMYADYAGDEALISEQRGQAEAMRDAAKSGMNRGVMAGDVYVADSPLSAIASIGGDAVNAMQQKKMNEQQSALNAQRAQGQQDMAILNAKGIGNAMQQGDPRAQAMREEEERLRMYGTGI